MDLMYLISHILVLDSAIFFKSHSKLTEMHFQSVIIVMQIVISRVIKNNKIKISCLMVKQSDQHVHYFLH